MAADSPTDSSANLEYLHQCVADAESFETVSEGLTGLMNIFQLRQPSVYEVLEYRVHVVVISIIVNSNKVCGRRDDLFKAVCIFREILSMKNPNILDAGFEIDGVFDEKRIKKFVSFLEPDDKELFDSVADCLMAMGRLSDVLRARIKRSNLSNILLKLLGRLDRPKFLKKAVELVEVVVKGAFKDDLSAAILTLIEHLFVDGTLNKTPEHTRRLIPVISQAINDGWQRNPSFVNASGILKELVKGDSAVADAAQAAGLVELAMRLLEETEQMVLIPMLDFLKEFASVSNKECDLLLQKGILTKVSRILTRFEGSVVDKCLLVLEAITCKAVVCVAAQLRESKLLETLETLYKGGSNGENRMLLVRIGRKFLWSLKEHERRRLTKWLSEDFQELLNETSS